MRIGGAVLVGLFQAALLAVFPLVAGASLGWPALLLLALLCVAAASEAFVSRPDPSAPPWLARASALALLVAFWLALGGASASPLAAVIGATLVVAGIALRTAAIVALGEAFVSAHRASTPRTHGLYRIIRHPSETGQLLLALGAAMTTLSWPAFTWWGLVVLPVTLVRVRDEERTLCASPAYRLYRASVPAFLPVPWTIARRERRAV